MYAVQVFGLVLSLTISGALYAQAQKRSQDDPYRKKSTPSAPAKSYTPPKPAPPPPSRPERTRRENEYTTSPPYRPRTERDYEPWRANRQSTSPKSSLSSTPKTQSVKSTPKPAEAPRDPALARCDRYKARMEQVIRDEQRGGDPARMQRLAEERKQVYQETMRAGC